MFDTLTSQITKLLSNKKQDRFSVALLSYDNYPSIENIRAGITDTVTFDPLKFPVLTVFSQFNAYSDENELYRIIRKNLCGYEYDLIFATGVATAQILQDFSDAGRVDVPIVYAGIQPQELTENSLLQSDLIGVISEGDSYKGRVAHLSNVARGLNNVVIIFDEHEEKMTNYRTCIELDAALRKQDIRAIFYGINNGSKIECNLKQFATMYSTGAIIGMKQTQVMSHMRTIAGVATSNKVPLFASDLSSVKWGAAIGCGTSDYKLGCHTGHIIRPLLAGPEEQEIETLNYVYDPLVLSLNKMNMSLQGLVLDPDESTWLKTHEVPEREY